MQREKALRSGHILEQEDTMDDGAGVDTINNVAIDLEAFSSLALGFVAAH